MENIKNRFKSMNFVKQAIVVIGTITLIIAILANYDNVKNKSKEMIDKISTNKEIRDFMQDINNLIQNTYELLRNFFTKKAEQQENKEVETVAEENKEQEGENN